MNFLDNITFRRNRTRSEPNDDESDIILSQTLNCTTSSLPEISEDEDTPQLKILKDEIASLTSQLASAHEEIEKLSLENCNLKKLNGEYNKRNDMYKKIVNSPGKIKSKTTLLTPKRNTKTKQTQTTPVIEKSCSSPINTKTAKSTSRNVSSSKPTQNTRTETTPKKHSVKRRICLISSETTNRLYTIAERTNLRDFEICHYRKPTCGLRPILHKIEGKVQDFTHSDYCVIYIGEEDFRKTHNYLELVMFIREKLMELNHTNFVICLPTFKYMTDANIMYNSRVEMFNNLLYLDINTYNYAYLLDSNLNLSYDHDSYSKRFGTLNKIGLKIVVSDLQDLILSLCGLNATHSGVNCHPQTSHSQHDFPNNSQQTNSQFFR